jgi:hypothetical protein
MSRQHTVIGMFENRGNLGDGGVPPAEERSRELRRGFAGDKAAR